MTRETKNCRWLLLHERRGAYWRYGDPFGRLYDGANLSNVLCAGFRITDQPDEWSQFVSRFKSGLLEAVDSAESIFRHLICHRSVRKSVGPVVVCPVLGSGDIMFTGASGIERVFCRLMDNPPQIHVRGIAASICDGRSVCYKRFAYSPLHSMAGREDRTAAVKGAYVAREFGEVGLPRTDIVFLIDDIVTLGSSMNDAARAIREANPSVRRVYGLALAKSERHSFSGVTNERLPAHIRRLAGIDG